jgi:tetratricopeptide (TPR) repeat protein/DNA-binding MarR family transcriptional regulator
MSKGQFKITVEDALLLHLLRFSRFESDFEIPGDVTQPGIAAEIGIRRSHAASAIKNLRSKNYVYDRTAHIKDIVRKRKVYFLTDEGKRYAMGLQKTFENKMVILIEEGGSERTIKLSEVNGTLSTNLVMTQLIELFSPDGQAVSESIRNFDMKKKYDYTTGGVGKKQHINFLDNMPKPIRFVGRTNELDRFQKWIEKDLPRILVLYGIPGIGKTTLASKFILDYQKEQRGHILWTKIHEWDTLESTLRGLSEFLSKISKKKLKFYMDEQGEIKLSEISKILEEDLTGLDLILVFDDYQKAGDKLNHLFSLLTELIGKEAFSKVKVMILSRETAGFYDRKDVTVKKIVGELKLDGLDKTACEQLLDMRGIKEGELEKIFKTTEGHPMTLELINLQLSSKEGESASAVDISELFKSGTDLSRYLREEVYLHLNSDEKRILEFISVFRYPVSEEAVFIDKEVEHDHIVGLLEKSLLHESSSGFELHELIREFVYRRLNSHKRTDYHREAAHYYSQALSKDKLQSELKAASSAKLIIEATHHSLLAGNIEQAANTASRYGDDLIRWGYSNELSALLKELGSSDVADEVKSQLLIIQGQIKGVNGEWDDALACYQQSCELCQKLDDNEGLVKAYNASGGIHYRKGEFTKAMDYYNSGLKIAKARKDDTNCSKLYSNIALVHWSNGELQQAEELLNESLQLSERLEDNQGIARAYNNLGIIYWEQEKLDDAKEAYQRSLELSKKLDDKRTIAILFDNLGEVYRTRGDDGNAEKFYRKSLELSLDLGFKWQIAEVYRNLGKMYQDQNRTDGKKYLKMALDIFTNIGAEREVAMVRTLLAQKS